MGLYAPWKIMYVGLVVPNTLNISNAQWQINFMIPVELLSPVSSIVYFWGRRKSSTRSIR